MNSAWKPFLVKIAAGRTKEILRKIEVHISKNDNIVDIGSGLCLVASALKKKSYKVVCSDVKNYSLFPEIKPVLLNGRRLPFSDNKFDVALLVTVLHHTERPLDVLREAKRVAKRIIVMEEIYDSFLQKHLTFFMDSLTNLQFINHPHTNKTDEDWKKIFLDMKLTLLQANYRNFWGVFTSAVYHLKK